MKTENLENENVQTLILRTDTLQQR